MQVEIDGKRYDVPEYTQLTFRETGLIKRMTGLRPLEYAEAWRTGDPDMILGLTAVALRRSGAQFDEDKFLDSPAFDTIKIIGDDPEEEQPSPPDEAAGGGEQHEEES